MNKVKKVLALILSVLLIFLVGCSSANQTEQELTTEAQKEPTGFVELNIGEEYLQNASSICSKDDFVVFMTSVLRDKDGNIVKPMGEEDYEGNIDTPYIVEYDAKKNEPINIFEIKNCPIKEIWGIELEGNRIVIFSNSEKKNAYYDLDMNFIEETDREIIDDLEIAKQSKYYTSMSAARDGYCDFDGSNNNQYLFFYDNPEEIYIFNADRTYQPNCMNKDNGYILSETFGNSGECADFRVVDYKGAKEINSASISSKKYGYEYISTNNSGFGNKYAVCIEYFGKSDSEDYMYKMFVWNYLNEQKNDALDIKKYTEVDTLNSQMIAEIKEKYGVDIHINELHDDIKDYVKCNEEINPLHLYDNILTLNAFFKSLPDGMIQEIYSGFSDSEFEANGIRVDIVSEITMQNDITNDVAAFAQRWSKPMVVCFAYNTLSTSNVSHEFMHLFDHRIDDYLNTKGTSIFNKWNEINADYSQDYNENDEFHRQYKFDDKYFITEYASSNDDEDRAVIFEQLYTSHNQDKPWLEPEGIKSKTDYLIKLLREAFPSVQKVEKAYWEY